MSFCLSTVQRYDIFSNPAILFPLFFLQFPHLLTSVISSSILLTLVNVMLILYGNNLKQVILQNVKSCHNSKKSELWQLLWGYCLLVNTYLI